MAANEITVLVWEVLKEVLGNDDNKKAPPEFSNGASLLSTIWCQKKTRIVIQVNLI